MKKIKALFAFFMAFVCLISAVPNALADDTYALNVTGDMITASRGDTVIYQIKATQKGRIYPASVHVEWAYDTAALTLQSVATGNLSFAPFEEYFPAITTDHSYDGFIYSEANEGVLVTLTFKVNQESDSKAYPIAIHADYYADEKITTNPLFDMYKEISSKYNCYSVTATSGSVTINAHQFGVWENHSDAQHKRECVLCHQSEYAPHRFDDGVVQTMPSCVTDGLKIYTCSDCQVKKEEIIPKTGDHVYGDWTQHDDTNHKRSCGCGDTQYEAHTLGNLQKYNDEQHKRACSCGYEAYFTHQFGDYVQYNADSHKQACACGEVKYTAHTWNAGQTTKPPQHLEEGIYTYTCTSCGERKDEAIPKTTTHNYGPYEKYDEEYHKQTCKCGEIFYQEHEWDAGKVTTPATNQNDGVYTYTCQICDDIKTQIIPKFQGSAGLKFRSNGDGTYSVSGIGDCTDTAIVIPTATPEGQPVIGVWRNAFSGNKTITSVTIPAGIQYIEKWAFRNCTSLTAVQIDGGLSLIGENAFQGCTALASIKIPSGIQVISANAFLNCTKLTSVTLPSGLLEIGSSAFNGCSSLTSLQLPSSLYAIYDSAFLNCKALTKITIPENVSVINPNTFKGCTALKTVKLPENLSSIAASAFESCTALTEISIPGSVKMIEDSAFYCCENLKTLIIRDGVSVIGNSAFYGCERLTVVELPDSIIALGSSAFSGCRALVTVKLSANLESIGSYCFNGCRKITRIVLPDTLTDIGENIWYDCTAVTEIFFFGTPAQYGELTMSFPDNANVYYYAAEKPETADQYDYWHYVDGEIEIWVLYIRGDMNGDGKTNSADAIYLLRHTIMRELYLLNQSGDVNGDGKTNSADAIYLLRHTIMQNLYPLA